MYSVHLVPTFFMYNPKCFSHTYSTSIRDGRRLDLVHCCNGPPIFRSSLRVSLFLVSVSKTHNATALSSSCVLFVSRVVWILLLLSQIEWWNKSCSLHRNTKRGCGGVKTYRGSHWNVWCWKMTVIRKGFSWRTFSVNNHSRYCGDLWRLFSTNTTAGKTTNSTYNTHH